LHLGAISRCAGTTEEWKQRVERPDNHWFDGMVGCAVAAFIVNKDAMLRTFLYRPEQETDPETIDAINRLFIEQVQDEKKHAATK